MASPSRFGSSFSGAGNSGCMRLFFGVFLVAGLGIIGLLLVYPLTMAIVSRFWEETPCRVLSSEVHRFRGKGRGTFRVDITYQYVFRGETHTSPRYTFGTGGSGAYDWKARVVAANPPGTETVCFVDPAYPSSAVMERGPTWEIVGGLLGLPFAAVGCLAFLPARMRTRFGRF